MTAIIHERGPGGRGGRSTRALSVARLMKLEGLSAIDIGSHEGYNAFDLYECGCRKVVGVELRAALLAAAEAERVRLGYAAVSFMQADVRLIDTVIAERFDLCLCSGVLYHMQNPFNLLKRLRNVCVTLALETHVAPGLLQFFRAQPKYRRCLTLRRHRVQLDGESFTGRLNVFPQQQQMHATSGSVDSHCTFWLDLASLLKALQLAGFDPRAVYYDRVPPGQPPLEVDHGFARSKVFVLADVREPGPVLPVAAGTIAGCDLLRREMSATAGA